MTGKNVKERIGLGGMDADRIREIMGGSACLSPEETWNVR